VGAGDSLARGADDGADAFALAPPFTARSEEVLAVADAFLGFEADAVDALAEDADDLRGLTATSPSEVAAVRERDESEDAEFELERARNELEAVEVEDDRVERAVSRVTPGA